VGVRPGRYPSIRVRAKVFEAVAVKTDERSPTNKSNEPCHPGVRPASARFARLRGANTRVAPAEALGGLRPLPSAPANCYPCRCLKCYPCRCTPPSLALSPLREERELTMRSRVMITIW
jgi:hypothetical protein